MDVPGNWWESFFNGVAVDLWLKAIPQSLTEMEADLIVHALQPAAGAELLDVPCGCGRLHGEQDPQLGNAMANALPVDMVEPVDISNAILWLVSDDARYVTGVTLPVDAGFTNKK